MYSKKFITQYGSMTCFKNDIVFYTHLYAGKIYEEELIIDNIIPILNNITNGNNIIILDIGSHIGSHTLLYSKLVPN